LRATPIRIKFPVRATQLSRLFPVIKPHDGALDLCRLDLRAIRSQRRQQRIRLVAHLRRDAFNLLAARLGDARMIAQRERDRGLRNSNLVRNIVNRDAFLMQVKPPYQPSIIFPSLGIEIAAGGLNRPELSVPRSHFARRTPLTSPLARSRLATHTSRAFFI
jgi:hypothetical protein